MHQRHEALTLGSESNRLDGRLSVYWINLVYRQCILTAPKIVGLVIHQPIIEFDRSLVIIMTHKSF